MEENNKMKKQSRSVMRTQNLLKTLEFFYSYCISGCIGLIENWISGDMHRSADEMATIAAEFVLHGFQAMATL